MRGIFLGLGSNCGECSRLMRDALVLLEERGVVAIARSSLYETEAVVGDWQKVDEVVDSGRGDVVNSGLGERRHDLRDSGLADARDSGRGDLRENFLNAVIEVETELPPHELLRVCMEVESLLGRVRREKWGARTMDIDLLLYGDQIILVRQAPELVVPHPLLQERNFVLVPLAEIAAQIVHPVLQQTVVDILRNSNDEHKVFASREKW